MENKQKRQADCGATAVSTVNLNKENTVIIRPKVSLDKSEAISKAKQERMDRITEQKFADYCQDINRFLKGRVFIPYSDEYNSCLLVNKLLKYLEEKTGKRFIDYYFEQEDVSGTFIMLAERLLDKERQYTYSDDIVYAEDGRRYHVNYYEQYNVLHIILDNPDAPDDFKVVQNLSEFSHEKIYKKPKKEIIAVEKKSCKEPDIPFEPKYEIPAETLEEGKEKSNFLSGLKDKVEDITLSIECFDYDKAVLFLTPFAGISLVVSERFLQHSIEVQLADEETLASMTEQEIENLQTMENLLQAVSPVFSLIALTIVTSCVFRLVKKFIFW